MLLGLLTALLWGLTDFLVGRNAKQAGALWSLLISNAVSVVILLPLVLGLAPLDSAALRVENAIYALLSAVLIAIGALLLCTAFKEGRISVIAPLVATYGCFTTFFAWLDGALLADAQYGGIVLCTLGVGLISQTRGQPPGASNGGGLLPVLYALGAAFCWGLSFWMQGAYVLTVLSAPQMLLLNSCVGLVLVGLTVLALALPRPRLPIEGQVSLVGAGVVNLAGFSSFAWGLSVGISSVVTVLSTLSGAIACLMAVVFLKERLQAVQMAGCVLIVCGAMILSAN